MGGPHLFNPMPVPQTGTASTTPAYRYPPTDTFSRGDSLHGSETTTRPSPPDYRKVQPAPNAVSGQNGGTGGGSCFMGFAISGGNTVAAKDGNAEILTGNTLQQASASFVVESLTPEASDTFTAKYKSGSGKECKFSNRSIWAIPLP